jgi:hypothetical protein
MVKTGLLPSKFLAYVIMGNLYVDDFLLRNLVVRYIKITLGVFLKPNSSFIICQNLGQRNELDSIICIAPQSFVRKAGSTSRAVMIRS